MRTFSIKVLAALALMAVTGGLMANGPSKSMRSAPKQTNLARYWTCYAPGPGATHMKELIFLSQSGVSVG